MACIRKVWSTVVTQIDERLDDVAGGINLPEDHLVLHANVSAAVVWEFEVGLDDHDIGSKMLSGSYTSQYSWKECGFYFLLGTHEFVNIWHQAYLRAESLTNIDFIKEGNCWKHMIYTNNEYIYNDMCFL